jgi:hypothetical protein
MSWYAVTAFRTIHAGTSMCVFATPCVAGELPAVISIGTELLVELADDARTKALVTALSGAEATIQLADGSRWIMARPLDSTPAGISWCGTPYQEWIIRIEVEETQT